MRRLRDFQLAVLQAGDLSAGCRVVATGAGEAVLEAEDPGLIRFMRLPARASLVFDTDRHPVMLSGTVDEGPIPDTVSFRVTDNVEVPQLRMSPRLSLATDVRVTPLDDLEYPAGPSAWHQTIDVSSAGLMVAGLRCAAEDRLALELIVPTLPRSVRCHARVVRLCEHGTAVAYLDLDSPTATMIDRVIFTVRQRVARRAFWTHGSLQPA